MKNWLTIIGLACIISCTQPVKQEEVLKDQVSVLQPDEGYQLLKNNCYACHDPKAASHDDLLAPPLAAVKIRYLRNYPDKESFVKSMVRFVQSPDPQNALMRGAVKEFNVMPKTALDRQVLEDISIYIYENKLEEPEWFAAHFEEMHGRRN